MDRIRIRGRNGVLAAGALGALALLAGCRQDMHNQPKDIPQRGSVIFADGRSARPQVENTVARGQLHEDEYFYTGLMNGKEQDMMPFPVTMTVLERGQERFNIYCTPCHSRVGNGDGMIVQRGYKPAGNFHDARRLAEPLSHYFYVMTHGYGAMPDYAAQLSPEDRWAVAAYIRALQLSQNAKLSDVPQGTQVHDLGRIAERDGLPASFAGPWPIAEDTNAQALPTQGVVAGAPAENPNTVNLTSKTEGNAKSNATAKPAPSGPKQ